MTLDEAGVTIIPSGSGNEKPTMKELKIFQKLAKLAQQDFVKKWERKIRIFGQNMERTSKQKIRGKNNNNRTKYN